ncbi:PAS domain S-box protein [Gimesia aquarii]|nr:PAS domain S-box protein [Gimesia aquarii]
MKPALWASDDRLQIIIDSAPDAVITMDIEGHVIDWNRSAEKIFGWSREEVTGKAISTLIVPPQYRAQHINGLRLFKETGKGCVLNQQMEFSALRRNGQEFPVELTVTQVEWDGHIIFNAFIRDISAAKEAEQLIAREKLEAALLEQASFSSSMNDALENALRLCVNNLCEISGWPVSHVFVSNNDDTRLISSRIWYTTNDNNFRALRSVSEKVSIIQGEDLPGQVWQSGEAVWITDIENDDTITHKRDFTKFGIRSAFGFPVKLDGKIIAVVEFFNNKLTTPDPNLLSLASGVANKISQMVERMQWQEERTRLAAIVDSSADAIISKALDGTITSWNSGAEIIYGWPADEAIGETITIILPPGMAREESEILEAMKTGRRLEQFQTRRMRKDGTIIDVSITVSPIRGLDGKIMGSSIIERDTTARRRREEELLKARDEAEQASRVQGEFLATVSHELRTPMNAILGMLELTLQEDLTPMKRDYLQTAKDSADSLLLLVNDILDFSRLEAGRFELEPISFNLRDLLDEVVKTLSLRAHEKGLELALHIKKGVPERVISDPVRFRQILINLIGNAIKFTEQGEVVIDAKLSEPPRDSTTETKQASLDILPGETVALEFQVSDTGIGIAPADQERIFAPFAQADASTTRQYSGSGLGLAICQEIVGLMDGQIWLESELGRGSQFCFRVSLRVAEPDEMDMKREQVTVDDLRELPVLVVDDNQTNRVILEEMLSNWSMSPTPVSSAERALQQLSEARREKKEYPLVIVDALMPETDGFMLLEQAQEQGLLESATILMLSSTDRQIFNDRCEGLEISAFLEKPVSQSDLLDAIMTAFKSPQLERDSVMKIEETPQSLNILIAEDTPANQKVITAILNKRGHDCTIANNGREAIDYLRSDSFDLMLMDVQMPTMDGLQATTLIREQEAESNDHIPIIAMTAYAMRGDRDRCLKAGMDDYISKPIDAKKLIRLVERYGNEYSQNRTPIDKSNTESRIKDEQFPSHSKQRSTTHSDSASKQSVINMQTALSRVGDDKEILNDMVNYFFEDSPSLLDEIRKRVQSGDIDEMVRAAHSLKGLCANFEAHAAVQSAKTIEDMKNATDLSSVTKIIDELEVELNLLSEELTRWQSENSENQRDL